MADSIPMALKVSVDASGVSTGFNKAKSDVEKFAAETRVHASGLSTVFDDARQSAGRIFENLKGGNFGGILNEARSLGTQVTQLLRPAAATFTPVAAEAAAATSSVAGLTASLGGIASAAAPVAIGVGLIAGGLVALGNEARAASREMSELSKFSERIGTSTTGAQTLLRSFTNAGLDRGTAEQSVNKFRDVLGTVHQDPASGGGRALRQLGLDPQEITGLDTEQAFRRVIVSLSQVENSFLKAHLSRELFGRGFQDLQEVIRRGGAGIDLAARQVATSGDTPLVNEEGRRAEAARRRTALLMEEASGGLRQDWRAVMARLDVRSAESVESVTRAVTTLSPYRAFKRLLGLQVPEEPEPGAGAGAASLAPASTLDSRLQDTLRNGPRVQPRAGISLEVEDTSTKLLEQVHLNETLVDQATRLGLVRAGATQQEAEGFRDLIELQERLRAGGASAAEQATAASAARTAAQSRQGLQARGVLEGMSRELDLTSNLRRDAEALGLVRANASQAELQAVRPLVAQRQQLARLSFPGQGVALAAFDSLARLQTATGVSQGAQEQGRQWGETARQVGISTEGARELQIQTAEAQLAATGYGAAFQPALTAMREGADALAVQEERVRRMSQIEGATNGVIQERLLLEHGISAERAAQVRASIDRREADELTVANRTPLEQFQFTNRLRSQNGAIDQQTQTRDIAARFRQAISGLGTGPSSYGLGGTDAESREGLMKADDFRIRGEITRDPEWAQRQLEALQRQERIQQESADRIVEALGGIAGALDNQGGLQVWD